MYVFMYWILSRFSEGGFVPAEDNFLSTLSCSILKSAPPSPSKSCSWVWWILGDLSGCSGRGKAKLHSMCPNSSAHGKPSGRDLSQKLNWSIRSTQTPPSVFTPVNKSTTKSEDVNSGLHTLVDSSGLKSFDSCGATLENTFTAWTLLGLYKTGQRLGPEELRVTLKSCTCLLQQLGSLLFVLWNQDGTS